METSEFVLSISQLEEQEINPNELEPEIYAGLVRSIERDGIKQRVLVFELGEGRYKIIDGHHRVKAAFELGLENVPVICIKGATEEDIMLLVILMNRAKGDFNIDKLVLVLKSLQKTYTKEQLEEYLAYTELDIDNFNAIADLASLVETGAPEKTPKESEDVGDLSDIATDSSLIELEVLLTRDNLKYVESTLYKVNTDKDKNANLVTVCTMFLSEMK